jgi:hypothetical protein
MDYGLDVGDPERDLGTLEPPRIGPENGSEVEMNCKISTMIWEEGRGTYHANGYGSSDDHPLCALTRTLVEVLFMETRRASEPLQCDWIIIRASYDK